MLGSIVTFYVTYLCYRNVKSYLPLARPELFDTQLLELERRAFGQDPAILLHDLLGTGIAAHVLSTVYLLFLTFVPISVGVSLVWSTNRAGGLWWVSVLSINWVLGALSYFLIPSMGPVFAAPELFTGAAGDRHVRRSSRRCSSIARRSCAARSAAASCRASRRSPRCTSRSSSAARWWRTCCERPRGADRAVGVLRPDVLATIYFGWHYVVDDIAGLAIGLASVYVGARAHRLADRAQQGARRGCSSLSA